MSLVKTWHLRALAGLLVFLQTVLCDSPKQPLKNIKADVRALAAPKVSSGVRHIALLGEIAFFNADDGVHGHELWRSDMTANGTRLAFDIHPGKDDSYPSELITYDGLLYFAADDGVHGREMWTTDGFQANLFADINPGIAGSNAQGLLICGSRLYFAARDAQHGFELWSTGAAGTGPTLLGDFNPGPQVWCESRTGTFHVADLTSKVPSCSLSVAGLGDHRFRVPRRRAAVRGGWQRMEERRQSKRHTGGARDKK